MMTPKERRMIRRVSVATAFAAGSVLFGFLYVSDLVPAAPKDRGVRFWGGSTVEKWQHHLVAADFWQWLMYVVMFVLLFFTASYIYHGFKVFRPISQAALCGTLAAAVMGLLEATLQGALNGLITFLYVEVVMTVVSFIVILAGRRAVAYLNSLPEPEARNEPRPPLKVPEPLKRVGHYLAGGDETE